MSNQTPVKKEQTEIVKKDIPAYLQVKDNELGTEGIGSSDIVIPRLKICQGLSSAAKKDIPELKDGNFYTNTGDLIGDKFSFFVLMFWRSTVWFSADKKLLLTTFIDPDTKENVIFGSDQDLAKLSPEQLAKKEIKMMDSHNYMIIGEKAITSALKKGEMPFPMIYSGGSASIKYCRQLNGKLKTNSLKKIPIYGQLVNVSSSLDTFKKGSAYMPRFTFGRFAEQDEFTFLKEFHKSCKALQKRAEANIIETDEVHAPETDVSSMGENMFDDQ